MHMNFVKMVQFTRLVKADERLREFNFKKLKGPEEEVFSVNVCNERGDRLFFNMEKREGSWAIQPCDLPKWILQNEKKLNDVLEDELKNWH